MSRQWTPPEDLQDDILSWTIKLARKEDKGDGEPWITWTMRSWATARIQAGDEEGPRTNGNKGGKQVTRD